jgi:L-threonylcarbamoyladenylate synthase
MKKPTVRTEIIRVNSRRPDYHIIRKASRLICNGEIVAFPTETVYGLGANALDPSSVSKIFKIKGRHSDNPLIVHIDDMNNLNKLVREIPPSANKIINKFWPGPITLVFKKSESVPDITAGGLNTVAIRMPRNNVVLALIKMSGLPIAAPSANISGRPSPTKAKHVKDDLDGKIKLILDGGTAEIGIESTVIDVTQQIPIILRPGGISKESIENEIGKVRFHDSLLGLENSKHTKNRSPGMKYRHYSPNAQVILVEGPTNKARNKIIELTERLKIENKRVCVMTTSKSLKINAERIQYMGKRFETIGRNLFSNLREADNHKIDVILVQGIQHKKIGFAIMNRLKKAASKSIRV